jgi:hypothetical protein
MNSILSVRKFVTFKELNPSVTRSDFGYCIGERKLMTDRLECRES